MLIFKGNTLLAGDGDGSFDWPDRPSGVLRCSLDFPESWQDLTAWCEVGEDFEARGAEWLDLRAVWHRFGEEAFARAGAAYQYMNWRRSMRFCSFCTAPLETREEDRGLSCPGCGRTFYAPLHPAIIVAVERDGKLLLAHNRNMPAKRYSVLAGFVEPGESLEQTVVREVREEVGIEIGGIRYFGSQSWPFPSSLMLGFTAHWSSGEAIPDGLELDEAGWFAPDALPDVPPPLSISRRLIDDFVRRQGGSERNAVHPDD